MLIGVNDVELDVLFEHLAHVRGPRAGFPGPDHELRRVALAAAEHALAALGPGRKGRRARR